MQPMLNIALRAARKAGEIIMQATDRLDQIAVESKGINDYVTEIDKKAEKEIIYQLTKAYPDSSIHAEESGISQAHNSGTDRGISNPESNTGRDYTWVIDPLDGTTNFIRGIPHFAVSIGCVFRGRLEHAVIVDPVRHEEFTASRGKGAQLNGRRLRVTKRKGLEGAVLATGIPYQNRQQEHLQNYMDTLSALTAQTAGIRRAGSAALDLAYVASGRLDGFWEIGLREWDIAAGALLLIEAGGLISDFNGGHDYLKNGNIVCGNPKVFKSMLQIIQPKLGYIEN